MADTLNNTSALNNLLSTYFVRTALPTLTAKAVMYGLCDNVQIIPLREGKVANFNAWRTFLPASAAITEGTTPQLSALSSRLVTATIYQYVRGIKITDLAQATASLDVLQGAVEQLTDSAGKTVDNVILAACFKTGGLSYNTNANILSAWMSCNNASCWQSGVGSAGGSTQKWGFNITKGTTCTRLSAVSPTAPSLSSRMSLYTIRKGATKLRGFNALPFADGYFKLVMNSRQLEDLLRDPTYSGWMQYTDPSPMTKGDVSHPVDGCRVYVSNNLPQHRTTAHSASVALMFGQKAFAVTKIGGGSGQGFEIIIKRSGPSDTSNPADLYMTAAYKITMAAVVTNPSAGRTLITVNAS